MGDGDELSKAHEQHASGDNRMENLHGNEGSSPIVKAPTATVGS